MIFRTVNNLLFAKLTFNTVNSYIKRRFFNFVSMNYPLFLAKRLSLARGDKKSSPAVVVAIIAVAIAISVMIASIAIVLGFKKEIRDKVVGFNSHITLYKLATDDDENLITLDNELKNQLDSISFIKDYSVTAAIPAILKTTDDFKGVYLKGLEGKITRDFLNRNLEEGEIPDYNLEDNKTKVLISRIAANKLKLNLNDKIDTYFISDDVRVRKLEIAGIFNTHFDQYDDLLIYGSLPLVAQLGNLPEESGTFVNIETDNFDKINEYCFLLQDYLNSKALAGESENFYKTDSVLSQGRGFFSWLSLLDTNVTVIIILMMIVGCVTLISGMLIIILERKKFIGLLRALGASSSKIRNVFIYMAIKIAFIGILIGDFFILVFLYLQEKYHFLHLDADSYYIDFVPVFLPPYVVGILNIGVLFICYLVLVLPSKFVGRISPAESMVRNE